MGLHACLRGRMTLLRRSVSLSGAEPVWQQEAAAEQPGEWVAQTFELHSSAEPDGRVLCCDLRCCNGPSSCATSTPTRSTCCR